MSVKDDAMTAVHAALLAAQNEATALGTDVAAAKAAVTAKGAALTQSQAMADALKLAHAALSGATAVAPMAASTVTFAKKWAMPAGAGVAALAAYAHWGLKLF